MMKPNRNMGVVTHNVGANTYSVTTPADVISATLFKRVLGSKFYEMKNHLGNVLAVVSDEKLPEWNFSFTVTSTKPVVVSYTDYYPFGAPMPGRNYSISDYRFGFNGKENDNEVAGSGGWQDYGMRMYNPSVARFFNVDPITAKYPELTPYQFASNTPIQAVDLDGLEAFIVHGTLQKETGVKLTLGTKTELLRITQNTIYDEEFRWNSPIYNTQQMRGNSAEALVIHVLRTRAEMLNLGLITEEEGVSLIGYSHGGNVSIQAAKILNDVFHIKVNLVTISTPAYNSNWDYDSNHWGYGNIEDPQGNPGINSHVHVRHESDVVNIAAGASRFYSNPGNTENYEVPNSIGGVEINGGVEAHTKFPEHPKLHLYLRQIEAMPAAPTPKGLNDAIKILNIYNEE